MARIAKAEIVRLNAEVAVERLVVARGLELVEQANGDLVSACPLCGTAGALVIDADNTWACSSCGKAGGAVEWVMVSEGVSLSLAVEMLREGLPLSDGSIGSAPKRASTSKLPPLDAGLPDDALLGEIAAFYHRTLLEAPEAAEYLERRGLRSAEMVEAFRVGFSNRTLAYRVPNRQRAAGRKLRAQFQSLGVLASSGHEAFRGSLVVPVVADGAVVQLYGRKIGTHLAAGTPLHTWLAGPRPLFNAAALAVTSEVVLAGSVLDALSLWSAGFRHVVAIGGVDGFDRSHLEAMMLNGVERVLFGFRRDDAGHAAGEKIAERLLGVGIECFRIEWPAGLDANDVLRASAQPTDAFAQAIRTAVWMGKGPTSAHRRPTPPAPPSPAAVDRREVAGDNDDPADKSEPTTPTAEVAEVVEDADRDGDDHEGGAVLASPVPALPEGPMPVLSADGDEMWLVFGERRWRLRGLARNTSFDVLRVLLSVFATGSRGPGFHVDHADLYSARARATFCRDAAVEIGLEEKVLRSDIGKVFGAADTFVEEAIRRAQEPVDTTVQLDEDERAAALELLCDPNLVERITTDFARVGMVGEATNCVVGYLAAVSRLLDRPLAVVVQSTSAAGKSALMDAVLDFVPEEDRVSFSAMTGQSLYYMGERDLVHKVLAIAEEEGAERASYALKLLQSEGRLSIASTGKDTSTGKLTTHPYRVEGPAAIFLTTTAIDIDEELMNRCIVLTVDEDRGQTRAIHVRQRAAHTLAGMLASNTRDAVLKVHRDAQRLLEPVAVVNPFADRLGFVDTATRTRRDHMKYLTLIDTVALLHQHQRERHTARTAGGDELVYIEATIADIALANRLAHEVLGRSLDELPPQTRRVLGVIDALVAAQATGREIGRDKVRFTRRDVREACGLSDVQCRKHLERLVDLEHVWVHKGERGSSYVYELVFAGPLDDPTPRLAGLVDVDQLDPPASSLSQSSPPSGVEFAPSSPPVRSPNAPRSPAPKNGSPPAKTTRQPRNSGGKARLGDTKLAASYAQPPATAAASNGSGSNGHRPEGGR